MASLRLRFESSFPTAPVFPLGRLALKRPSNGYSERPLAIRAPEPRMIETFIPPGNDPSEVAKSPTNSPEDPFLLGGTRLPA